MARDAHYGKAQRRGEACSPPEPAAAFFLSSVDPRLPREKSRRSELIIDGTRRALREGTTSRRGLFPPRARRGVLSIFSRPPPASREIAAFGINHRWHATRITGRHNVAARLVPPPSPPRRSFYLQSTPACLARNRGVRN